MRILVDIRKEDQGLLEDAALREHRTLREQAAYLLHLKIQEVEGKPEPDAIARAS